MKKVLFLAIALVIGMVSMAQSVKSYRASLTQYLDVAKNEVYFMKNNEVITQADTLANYVIGLDNANDAYKQYARIKITENSGTAVIAYSISGKTFVDESYTSLASGTYTGTGSDTTIVFDGSTAKNYRLYKITLDGDGSGTFNATCKSEIKFYK